MAVIHALDDDRCADTSQREGNLRLLVKTNVGSVWFFSRLEWELSEESKCAQRARGCSADADWDAYIAEVRPPQDAGKDSRIFDIVRPLPFFKRGLLRYFANPDAALADNISVFVDDLENTGAPDPALANSKLPCCCIDANCTSCAQTSDSYVANHCVIRLNVTSCARVEGWMCRQAASVSRTPDLQVFS